jgi:hypothetical protein
MEMKKLALASLTAGLMLSVAPVMAQMDKEQKGPGGGGSPQMQGSEREPGMKSGGDKSEPKARAGDRAQSKEPTGKGTAQTEPKGKEPSNKGTAQTEPKGKEPSRKGAQTEPTGRDGKGTANQATEPRGKDSKGTAEKSTEPRDKGTKGTAEKGMEPKDKGTKGTAEKGREPQDKAIKGTAEKGSSGRVQVSEQQRTNIGQTITREKNFNRVTNVNFSINVGTRVPRSVHLVALPASVISIVPAYRSYHYFAVGDDLCIVDPATYEIVDVIVVRDQTAGRASGGPATLVLTDAERAILLREIDLRDGSTMGLGALAEGADVPRNIELRVFPETVIEKVPKLRGHKFFTAENRLAIVDAQGARVALVLEDRR